MSTTTDHTTEMVLTDAGRQPDGTALPTISGEARARLGVELRSIYADLCETQPITDTQVDLLLQLRHKERDRRRAA